MIVQIAEGITHLDRIQSLFFLFRMEYDRVCVAALAAIETLRSRMDSLGESAVIARFIQLLRD